MTTETVAGSENGFTTEKVSFITDDIIVQRYVEIEGELKSVLAVHKMRGSAHSHDFRTYEITETGAVVGGPLKNYRGIMSGHPKWQLELPRPRFEGLTQREQSVLETLARVGDVTHQDLAERCGLSNAAMRAVAERLTTLGYVTGSPGNTDLLHATTARDG